MFTERLARAVVALGRLDVTSTVDALHRVTTIASRGVPGCAGATATLWRDGEIGESAVSHPDLGVLLDLQHATGCGPAPEAYRTGKAVLVEDTMREARWPDFAKAAVLYGVRSLIVLPLEVDGTVVVFALYAVRPRVFDEPSIGSVAELLAHQLAVAVRNADAYDDVASEASQMRRAFASRADIEQAKGIIMHARGVDADTAFEELRRVSQRTQTKLCDVARGLVEDYARRLR